MSTQIQEDLLGIAGLFKEGSRENITIIKAVEKLRIDEQIRVQSSELNEIVNRLSIFAEQLDDCAEACDVIDESLEVECG